jgi:hypothetical protein
MATAASGAATALLLLLLSRTVHEPAVLMRHDDGQRRSGGRAAAGRRSYRHGRRRIVVRVVRRRHGPRGRRRGSHYDCSTHAGFCATGAERKARRARAAIVLARFDHQRLKRAQRGLELSEEAKHRSGRVRLQPH